MTELFQLFYQTSGVFTDSRNVLSNGLFIALKGANFNGNSFAEETISKGAKFAIVDDIEFANNTTIFYAADSLVFLQKLANFHRRKFNIPFIAITGSNGKTTSKELIFQVLNSHYNALATKGNLNNHIGVPLTLLSLNEKHEIAIIEMGANKPHDIAELCEIAEPTHGYITNIGAAHLEGFGNFQGVLKTKLELFDSIKLSLGTLVVNKDDEVLTSNIPSNIETNYFSVSNDSELVGKVESLNPCLNFSWQQTNSERHIVRSYLFGSYNIYNFLAAIRFGVLFNVPVEKINRSLEEYVPSNNRSQITKTAKNTLLVDCYNANPSSMLSAISSFAQTESKDKLAILGDMLELGKESFSKHREVILLLNSHNLNYLTVGPLFAEISENQSQKKYVKTEDLSLNIQKNQLRDKFILLKGSRGIALEKLIPLL